ncbi:unnamed protein product [Rodentolepis nana]|uniref:Sulfate_transp domain-containing protein n=1 Tax=Rodentolepis nana TaxID=102285 RepID=A0A0R3T822_RODNA|nr:unnamed protein product [Rodentolepis nana]
MNNNSVENTRVEYNVQRFTYTQKDFDDEFQIKPKTTLTFSKLKSTIMKAKLSTFGFALFPVFPSLMSYYTLHLFAMDIIAGITMAFFHLPQGMAYGALAGLRPVNGLYTSFFPVLVYFFFCTSRHNSLGTFSLASLLFSEPINRVTNEYFIPVNSSNSTGMTDEEYQFRLKISLTLALCVGLLQIIMALVQVGFLATYLSGPLISGFMCASAFHVLSSQFSSLFGINLPKVYGPGNFFIKFYNLCAHVKETNVATVIICIICIGILHIFRLYINPYFRKKFKFPVPVELLIVVASTIISHFVKFHERWGVGVVGHIPSGLPAPVLPTFSHFSQLIPDIFVVAIITFAINAGLVKNYAAEFGYDVLDNQELLAMGISNTIGALFKCHTACGALGRTAVVVTVGMASQV